MAMQPSSQMQVLTEWVELTLAAQAKENNFESSPCDYFGLTIYYTEKGFAKVFPGLHQVLGVNVRHRKVSGEGGQKLSIFHLRSGVEIDSMSYTSFMQLAHEKSCHPTIAKAEEPDPVEQRIAAASIHDDNVKEPQVPYIAVVKFKAKNGGFATQETTQYRAELVGRHGMVMEIHERNSMKQYVQEHAERWAKATGFAIHQVKETVKLNPETIREFL